MIWKREVFNYQGQTVQAPLPAGQGTGMGKALKLINHPVRADIPIWWASLKDKSVEATAELAAVMTEFRVRHLPVVDADGRLLAIVSIGDVVKARLDTLTDERDHLINYVQQEPPVGRVVSQD